MKLGAALDIRRGEVVAFVGAGGKTTAMFRLAQEMVDGGWRVISTTTTRVAEAELDHAPHRIGIGQATAMPPSLPEDLDIFRHVFLFTKLDAGGKVRGLRAAWLDYNLTGGHLSDAVLVEADGSRRLPLKGPLHNEPVIPERASLVVPVMSMAALGQPLSSESVYGAEEIARLTGVSLGAPVDVELMAAVLLHPHLGLKNVPAGARIAPLLNQVYDDNLDAARAIARIALTDATVDRVLLGAVREADPIREVRRRVSAVILAAGASARMGEQKLLMPWSDETMIRHVVKQVIGADLADVIVVAGGWYTPIKEQIADLPVQMVYNPEYEQGEMITSLQFALRALWPTADAALIVLGDQPQIKREIVDQVVDTYYRQQGAIVAPVFNEKRGHPVLIDRRLWRELLAQPAGGAPRTVLNAHEDEIVYVSVNTDSVIQDIDTPEDYQRALENQADSDT
jgi:molybdenum cofactor cytidylyltransferase